METFEGMLYRLLTDGEFWKAAELIAGERRQREALAKRVEALERGKVQEDATQEGPTFQQWAELIGALSRLNQMLSAAQFPKPPAPAPSGVVHPISAEHPLVVGDVVYSRKQGNGVVTSVDVEGNWGDDIPNGGAVRVGSFKYSFHAITGKAYLSTNGWDDEIYRVAHAPRPGPAPTQPDFDTQAREAGYVKAEEVAREFESRYPRWLEPSLWATLFVAWLRAQAKGGAK